MTKEKAISYLGMAVPIMALTVERFAEFDEAIRMAAEALEEPQWISWNSENLPKESGTYIITAYDGVARRVTYAKYQKRLKRWELTGARAYWRVLAYMPLPEPWGGDNK